MNKYSLIVSKIADEMMTNHAIFLANVSQSASLRFIEDYEKTLLRIEKHPFGFPIFDEAEIDIGYRKCVFNKRYLILFRVEETAVFVDYVVDCRQNFKELLR